MRPLRGRTEACLAASVSVGALLLLMVLGLAGGAQPAVGAPGPTTADPGDWPMYGHDPARTNTNPAETGINAGNVAQLVARWQVNLGGVSYPSSSTPSVAAGQVYVGSSAASGDNFFAFDAQSGRRTWGANLHYLYRGCFDVGIGATAAISGNVVVAGGGDPAYYALDARTGAQLWRVALNAGESAFPWASPLLANGRAYLGVASRCDDPSVRGEVRAVDLATGAMVNRQYFVPAGQAGAGVWNSPALSPDGTTLVVATGEDYNGYNGPYNRAIITLDPLSLAIRQAHQEGALDQDLDFGTTPVIFHDDVGRVLIGANHKDGTFYTYDLNNLNDGPIWQRTQGRTVGMMPAYDPAFGSGGTLFFVGVGGQLYSVNPRDGSDRWPTVYVGPMHGNIAIANGLIYANTGSGGLVVLDESNGRIVHTLVPAHAGDAYSGVAVAHSFVYWVAGGYLNAWSFPGTPPAPTPCALPFADVHPTDYFYTPVSYLYCAGVIAGYGDGTFRPYAETTRGQLVKIVVGAFSIPPYNPPTPTFRDVPPTQPFYAPIEAAAHAGIVVGYGDGTFRPSAPVTRGQLAKIVANAAGWAAVTPASATFADVPASSPFFAFVEAAACHVVISGYTCGSPGEPCDAQQRPYYRPGALAIRGQIAKIVYIAQGSAPACGP